MKIKILQGISGSGKSTYAKRMADPYFICSADDFFVNSEGEYNFDRARLNDAHAHCLIRFVDLVVPRHEPGFFLPELVVVDNTNTTVQEIAPYYALASAYKHDVEVVTFHIDPEVAEDRNVHGVPPQTLKAQNYRLQGTLKYWPKHWTRSDGPNP